MMFKKTISYCPETVFMVTDRVNICRMISSTRSEHVWIHGKNQRYRAFGINKLF
jgi:hypothetical protein